VVETASNLPILPSGFKTVRQARISSATLGVIAKIDVAEAEDGAAVSSLACDFLAVTPELAGTRLTYL
jgi:hypothetical protein